MLLVKHFVSQGEIYYKVCVCISMQMFIKFVLYMG